ncbi:MAG: hypothetical protein R3D25_22660 [Geminicoccaceae bacterium]
MMRAATTYVRWVDAPNRVVGRLVMLLIFRHDGRFALLVDFAERLQPAADLGRRDVPGSMLVAYFLLGGGYSM